MELEEFDDDFDADDEDDTMLDKAKEFINTKMLGVSAHSTRTTALKSFILQQPLR